MFDPLGLVSPFVIRAKILQETWARGYDWDDVICDEVAGRIGSWYDELRSLASVQAPRCLREEKEVIAQRVVTLVDASIQAYGTAVYLQCGYSDATTSSRLIASKSKVAPLKPMTVPRLELMGAVLGLRLTQHLIELLGLPMQTVTFYSDSMDVLWWVRGHGRSFRPFVANRVGLSQHSGSTWAQLKIQLIFVQEGPPQRSWKETPFGGKVQNGCYQVTRLVGPRWMLEDIRPHFQKQRNARRELVPVP